MFILIASSCSQDDEAMDAADQLNAELSTIKTKGSSQYSNKPYVSTDCELYCIDSSKDVLTKADDYYIKTDFKTENAGPNHKKVTYEAYNTLTHFVVEVKYEITAGTSSAEATITVNFEDQAPQIFSDVVKGSTVTATFQLPSGWAACNEVDFSIKQEGLSANLIWANVPYNLIGACETSCTIIKESAYAGNTVGQNSGEPSKGFNNAWWYAFDITGDPIQNVYAGAGNVIGTATYDAVAKTITIDLGTWELDGVSESVKWYSYANDALPTAGRPIPGQSDVKGTSLIIDTSNGDRYYVIHLNVTTCQ